MAKDSLWNRIWNRSGEKSFTNSFNKAFFQFIGGTGAQYDNNSSTYLEKGYKINPIVFSVITQMCDKTKAVPYAVKKVKDERSAKKISDLRNATSGNYSIKQLAYKRQLEIKAYEEQDLPFPLEHPNPNQTWADIRALSKLFLKLTGNVYWFKVSPEEGLNANVPQLVYILPSHKMKIVLKKNADVLYDEDPIDYYMMIEGDQSIPFMAKDVFHIKTPNPFFDMQGSHLYGLSPMTALLKNIESSNDALDSNIKTLKNSGVFGFITGKNHPLDAEQATQMKQRMIEMDNNPGRMSKIAGGSIPIEFTKLSLNTDELKPFDYLKYDQKQICNVLGWSDSLLNNDDGGKYDKQKEERKRVITDNIQPDLIMIDSAFTWLIRFFKGYEKAFVESDITELPEMQHDHKEMVEWMNKAWLKPNEIRTALKFETYDIDGMDVPRDPNGKRVDEVGITNEDVEKSYNYLND
jgi:phage portal protein BeeE